MATDPNAEELTPGPSISLEVAVEDTAAATIDDPAFDPALEGQPEPEILSDAQSLGLDSPDAMPIEDAPADKPVQVAGMGKGLIGAAQKLAKSAPANQGPKPMSSGPPTAAANITKDRIVIVDADETTAARFRQIYNMPADQRVPIYKPNLGSLASDNISTTGGGNSAALDDVTRGYVDALNILYEQEVKAARRGTMKIDDIMKAATKAGFDQAFLDVVGRQIGDKISPEILAKSLWVFQHTSAALDDVMMNGTDEEVLQMLPIAARVTMNAGAAAAEAGRSMAVLSHAGKTGALANIERLSNLPDMLKRYGVSLETVQDMRAAYTALPKDTQRKTMARGLIQKGLDVWAELYINAFLSSPVTHAVNIASNLIFGMFQLPERALAGVIGAIRTNIFRGMTSEERVYMSESMAMLQSLRYSLGDAYRAAARAMVDEEETFGAMTKVDTRQRRAISSEYLMPNREPGLVTGAVDAVGVVTRLMGSRLLLAEDEFAKGIAYQAEIYAQATRRMESLVANGMDPADAAKEGAAILNGRDATAVRRAQEMAQRMTFQGKLGPVGEKISAFMSHPLIKVFVPFYKTPTNIVKETLSRTPLGLIPGSGFWSEFKAGGASADMALARITMGTGLFATFAMASTGADDGNIILTGAEPSDKTAAAAWRRQKLQAYSIAVKNEDGTYTSYDYSRFAPIAGVLAMAADFAQYAQYEDDPSVLEQLAIAGPLSMYNVLKELPMLQGMFQIADIFGSEYETGRDKIERAFELLAKQFGTAAISAIPLAPTGSLTATVERTLDPKASSPMLSGDQVDANPLMRGFYEALQRAKSRNPFFSRSVERKLNLYGEEMRQCENGLWCFISPIRVLDSKYNAVDQEMVRLGLGVPMPKKTQRGIKLNAEQYNRMIIEMNTIDNGINAGSMLEEMAWRIQQPDYQDAPIGDNEEDGTDGKIGMLRSIKNARLKQALDTLFGEDPSLQAKWSRRKAIIQKTGKVP